MLLLLQFFLLLLLCSIICDVDSKLSFVPPIIGSRSSNPSSALQSPPPTSSSINDNDYIPPPYPLDNNGRPIDIESNRQLLNGLQTPHSGRKFSPTHPSYSSIGSSGKSRVRSKISRLLNRFRRNNRRFTEGWYYRLTLPEYNESFVFIFSIEDAGRYIHGKKSPLTLSCMQLLGPNDTYLVQSDEDDTKFWGWKYAQGLGCTFEWKDKHDDSTKGIAAMTPEEWRERVKSGFQILPFHIQGRLDGHDGSLGGVKLNQGIPGSAEFDITIRPVAGWGSYPPLSSQQQSQEGKPEAHNNTTYDQFSTAGWLANFPVFEPHWQITMAHARATGSCTWNGTVYEFNDAPFYGEKNWGGAFPTKWYWSQCNSFDGYKDLAFTAGGGIRLLPFSFLPGKRTETLGLIGIHYNGVFYEIVPWLGSMEWEVSTWGEWKFRGRCTDNVGSQQKFEADIIVTTNEDVPGVLLRAPTKDKGMQYFCRDSGYGLVTLSLYELEWDSDTGDYIRSPNKAPIIDKAQSNLCTVEVGGGPWPKWKVESQMSPVIKKLIRLPYALRNRMRWKKIKKL